jgi:hypothetical protein
VPPALVFVLSGATPEPALFALLAVIGVAELLHAPSAKLSAAMAHRESRTVILLENAAVVNARRTRVQTPAVSLRH